ncbi:MAG: cation transporter [Gammaproteobacteria bacterium]|nr:cation transporter [Gammaproteobacteria bacterium]
MNETANHHGDRYQDIRRVTAIGTGIDLLLSFLKLIFGFIGNSQALIADGIHSLSDLATNVLVIVSSKQGAKAPDEDHPYGHARIETMATVALGLVLAIVGIGIGWDAYQRILNPEKLMQPSIWALMIAIFSIFSKEWVYWITIKVAEKHHSTLLKANAWHARSDSISSVIVVLGIAGTMLGYASFDAYAAVGVGIMIIKIGGELILQSLKELMEAAVDSEEVKKIEGVILSVDGVKGFHELRTRSMGGRTFVDVHIQVEPAISVSEGHFISEMVRWKLQSEVTSVEDTVVHTDVEDDQSEVEHKPLRARKEIINDILEKWHSLGIGSGLGKFSIHYLPSGTKVIVVVHLEQFSSIADARSRMEQMQKSALEVDGCDDLRVHFCAHE